MLAAKLAAARHEKSETVTRLKDAVAIQDTLKYGEPPGWFYPVRESLGAALFLDGKTSEAEQTFREDLARNPRNPRSLFGLLQALRAQSKSHDATFVQAEFMPRGKATHSNSVCRIFDITSGRGRLCKATMTNQDENPLTRRAILKGCLSRAAFPRRLPRPTPSLFL